MVLTTGRPCSWQHTVDQRERTPDGCSFVSLQKQKQPSGKAVDFVINPEELVLLWHFGSEGSRYISQVLGARDSQSCREDEADASGFFNSSCSSVFSPFLIPFFSLLFFPFSPLSLSFVSSPHLLSPPFPPFPFFFSPPSSLPITVSLLCPLPCLPCISTS